MMRVMRPSIIALLTTSLLLGGTLACKKQSEVPSIKVRGYSEGSGLASGGASGELKRSEMTTDADGRRFEDLEFLSDGVTIRGQLVLPQRLDPAPTVVLVHMLGRDRSTWKQFQLLLADEGIGSLAIDLRGHGSSEGGPAGYEKFSPKEWQGVVSDVRNAVHVLEEYPDRINVERLGIIGASIGANAAIELGTELEKLPIIALSAGKDYKGILTTEPLAKLRQRVLLAAETGDTPAADLLNWAQDAIPEATFFEEEGADHGTNMLPNGSLEAQILSFLRERWKLRPDDPGGPIPDGLPEDTSLMDDMTTDDTPEEPPVFEEFEPVEDLSGDDTDDGSDDTGGGSSGDDESTDVADWE